MRVLVRAVETDDAQDASTAHDAVAQRLVGDGALRSLVPSAEARFDTMREVLERCTFMVERARAPRPMLVGAGGGATFDRVVREQVHSEQTVGDALAPLAAALRPVYVRRHVEFPDRRLVQFDW